MKKKKVDKSNNLELEKDKNIHHDFIDQNMDEVINLSDYKNVDLSKVKSFKYIAILNKEKRFFLLILILLLITIIIQGIINYKLFTENKILVLPPQISKEFWLTDKQLSESYFEQVSYFIADRVLSISPENANNSLVSIMGFLSNNPKEVKDIKKKIKDQAEFIKRENLYQSFYPQTFKGDYKNNILEVTGNLKIYVGTLFTKEIKDAKFLIEYTINNGKFTIKNIDFSSVS